jgi:hypothetical protein
LLLLVEVVVEQVLMLEEMVAVVVLADIVRAVPYLSLLETHIR